MSKAYHQFRYWVCLTREPRTAFIGCDHIEDANRINKAARFEFYIYDSETGVIQ